MKISLTFLCAIVLAAACGSSKSEQPMPDKKTTETVAPEEELPTCTIKKIESCEVESEGPGGTVYSCPHCGKEGCEDCADHEPDHKCQGCGDTPCRCRMEQESSP